MVITASQARAELFPLIQQVNEDSEHIVISSKNGNAVLVSESEWESLLETVYLMRNPQMWADIQAGIDEVRAGKIGKPIDVVALRKDYEARSKKRAIKAPAVKRRASTPKRVVKKTSRAR